MDLALSAEQRLLIDTARAFVRKSSPSARFRRLRDAAPGWEPSMWKQMAELGWLALPIAERHGGLGGGVVEAALLCQELGEGLVPEPFVASVVLAGMTLAEHGSPEQRERFLAPMLAGGASLALAYAEAHSRYDITQVRTTARRVDGVWRLSGEKVWVDNGHAADHLLVLADSGDGLSLFVVDGAAEGLERRAVHGMDGRHTGWLRLDGVRVDDTHLVGARGAACGMVEAALDRGVAVACAEGVGMARVLLAQTVDYLKTRKQFGVAIGTFQALQHRAADMFVQLQLLESMTLLAALECTNADASGRRAAVSAAKVQLCDSAGFMGKEAIQLHGGVGCTDELDVGLYFKRLRVLCSLYGDRDVHLRRYAELLRG